MPHRLLLGVLLLFVAACAPAPAEPTRLAVVAIRGDGTSAAVSLVDTQATVAVTSPRGIGQLTLAHEGGPFPQGITLDLPLAGLEELRLSYGEETIVAALDGAPPHNPRQLRVAADGSERPLAPGDPHWLTITISPEQQAQPFPLAEPGIVVALPPDLIAAAPRELTVGWVDFFR